MPLKIKMRILTAVLILANTLIAGEWPRVLHIYSGSAPIIDGNIAPGEYDDAVSISGVGDWTHRYNPVTSPNDLSVKIWAKHDGSNLYFALKVTDDFIYGVNTDRWLPVENKKAHEISRTGFPWFGDGVELLINASNQWDSNDGQNSAGDGSSWQMVCNTTKSLLGGIGKGGLMQGEPRTSQKAWDNYTKWVKDGSMKAAVGFIKNGYIVEWQVKANPCLEIKPGVFWNSSLGEVRMGLNIGIQDFEQKEKGNGQEFSINHENWWTGEKNKSTWLKQFGTLIIHPEKKRIKRSECFVGMHFDFHAGPDAVNLGKTLTPEMVEELIDRVQPDYIQVDTKGHPGYSSYPTKVGNPAASFVKDPMRIWRDATAKKGVNLVSHYSGVWDTAAVAKHPEWAAIDAGGEPNKLKTCLYGPYVDELLIPQLKELRGEYGLDSVWIDGECWAVINDYCPKFQAEYEKVTGSKNMPKNNSDPNFIRLLNITRQAFRDYLNHYVTALHYFDQNFEICSNWLYSSFVPEAASLNVDYISGDLSGIDGVNAARMESRVMRSQGKPWDLMAWSFFLDFNAEKYPNTKPAIQLQQEAAAVMAQGGGFQVYYRQRGDNSIYTWQMGIMEQVAKFCRQRQPYCFKTEPVPQVALILSTDAIYNAPAYKPFGPWWDTKGDMLLPLNGSLTALLENQYSVEIYIEKMIENKLNKYPLVIVPEWQYLDKAFIDKLLAYVQQGGNLIVIGPQTCSMFKDALGVKFDGGIETKVMHMELNGHFNGGLMGYQKVVPEPNTEMFGRLYTEHDYEYPYVNASSIAKYGKGRIAGIYFDFSRNYLIKRTTLARDFLAAVVNKLEPKFLVRAEGSHNVDVSVNQKDGKLLIGIVNTSGPIGDTRIQTFDQIPAVLNLKLYVNKTDMPKSVKLQPSGEILKYEKRDTDLIINVPKVEIYDIVEVVY